MQGMFRLVCELTGWFLDGSTGARGPNHSDTAARPCGVVVRRHTVSCTPQSKIHHCSSLPLGVQENEKSFLFVLSRVFYSDWIVSLNNSPDSPCHASVLAFLWNRFSHQSDTTRSACLRSLGTAQVASHDPAALLQPAGWSSRVCCQLVTPPLWSTHRSLVVSITILWFLLLRLTPAPFGLGCVSLCVLLCRFAQNRQNRHFQQPN